jgi:PAS domain S-box-containing protein
MARHSGRGSSEQAPPASPGPLAEYARVKAQAEQLQRARDDLSRALAEAERAAELLEHGDAFLELDAGWRILRVNANQERMSGKPRSESVGRVLWEVWPDVADPLRRFSAEYHRCMEERVPVQFEDYFEPLDMWTAITAYPTSGGGIAIFLRDITERRRAAQAMQSEHAFISAVLDTVVNVVIVLDGEGRIVRLNAACERLTGYTAAELIGRHIFEVLIPQEDLPGVRATFGQLRAGQFPNQHQNRWRTKAGAERWLEFNNTCITDDRGDVKFVIGTAIDITERRLQEERLRESAERFQTLADHIAQFAWIADETGWIFWYNRRWYEYTGTKAEEMVGWGWQSVHDPEWLPKVIEHWKAALASGEPFEMEFPLRGADGVYRWFLTRAVPVRDLQGKVTRWFGTNTNVHEQREASRALQISQDKLNGVLTELTQARDELEIRVKERTADLERAEESLRTLSARLLQAQDEERRRIARELHDSAGQLLTALNMNLVPIQSDAHKLGPASVRAINESFQLIEQLSKELRTISHLLHPPMLDEAGLEFALQWYVEGFAERSKIEVDFELAPDLGRLPRDAEIAIFRLVQESLTNIHRHASSPTASVRVFREGNQVQVRITDQGKGMPAGHLNGKGAKAGVGVQGMRERLRQLKGKLEIHSGPKGTTVHATLPAPVAQLSAPAPAI